jgi:hypothetical protein
LVFYDTLKTIKVKLETIMNAGMFCDIINKGIDEIKEVLKFKLIK